MKRNLLRFVLLSVMSFVTLSASATPDKNYLCFTANTDNSTVELTKVASGTIITAVIEYSTDGTSWTAVDFSANTTTGTITLSNAGDKVYFRNAKPASEDNYFSRDSSNFFLFKMAGSIAASGNIMSLVDLNCQATTISQQCTFYKLFFNCTKLTSAPELPATTLATSCYYQMFYQCGLTSAPELPATTLATNCYYGMFYYCKDLTSAPELPATTLATSCYYQMFKNCSSLNDMKVAFSKFSSSMTGWVSTVASTGTFSCPEGLTGTGTSKIPTGWTVKNTYDLTITSETGWASMCVNLPLQVPEDVEVYYASAVDGTTIELTQIEAGTVMAPRTAIIVKGAKGTVGFPIVAAAGTSYPTNLFQGSSVAKACNAGENYVLNASKSSDTNVHFSIYTGTTLTDHKAYLPKSAVGGATGSIQFRFGDATAISTVEMESSDDVLYNMAGQRVSDDYRGIVIKNGKKMFNL